MDLLDIPISKLMSEKITTLNHDDTVGFAILKMIQTRFSRLPVLTNGDLAGIFTTTDILRVIDEAKTISVLQEKLDKHMVKDVITAEEDQSFGEIISLMAEKEISCLPILSDNRLSGVYTNKDFMLFNVFWAEAPEIIVSADNKRLRQFFTAFRLFQDSTISTIISTMNKHDLNYILLVDKDHDLVTSVSKDRIIRSIASRLIIEGFDMGYIDEEVLDLVVTDPVFKQPVGLTLNEYRKLMNSRGLDSVYLTNENDEVKYILNEETLKDIAFDNLIKK